MKEISEGIFSINSSISIDNFRGCDVLYIVASGNNTEVHLMDGRKLMVIRTLCHSRKRLSQYIIHCGKSLSINPSHVTGFNKINNTICFENGSNLVLRQCECVGYAKFMKKHGNIF